MMNDMQMMKICFFIFKEFFIYAVNIMITSTETSYFITELKRLHEKVQEITTVFLNPTDLS